MTWIHGMDNWIICRGCGGRGWVEVNSGYLGDKVPKRCPLCFGSGGHKKPTGLG